MFKNFLKKSIQVFSLLFIINLWCNATYAGESNVYGFTWLDPDKEVYVLQNRKYRKDGRFHASLGGGITTNGAFVDGQAYQVRAGFFFMEDWGFEALYSLNKGSENSVYDSVVNNGGAAGSTPFRRVIDNYFGGMVMWSPFYAKVNTFNKVVYVDWMLGLGYAKMQEHNNRQAIQRPVVINPQEQTENHGCLMWGTGLKFYINEMFNVRLDLNVLHYEAQKALSTSTTNDTTYYSHYDLALSFGINL